MSILFIICFLKSDILANLSFPPLKKEECRLWVENNNIRDHKLKKEYFWVPSHKNTDKVCENLESLSVEAVNNINKIRKNFINHGKYFHEWNDILKYSFSDIYYFLSDEWKNIYLKLDDETKSRNSVINILNNLWFEQWNEIISKYSITAKKVDEDGNIILWLTSSNFSTNSSNTVTYKLTPDNKIECISEESNSSLVRLLNDMYANDFESNGYARGNVSWYEKVNPLPITSGLLIENPLRTTFTDDTWGKIEYSSQWVVTHFNRYCADPRNKDNYKNTKIRLDPLIQQIIKVIEYRLWTSINWNIMTGLKEIENNVKAGAENEKFLNDMKEYYAWLAHIMNSLKKYRHFKGAWEKID